MLSSREAVSVEARAQNARAFCEPAESIFGFQSGPKSDSSCWLGWRPAWMPGKPRSEDLRVRAIAAVLEEGLSRREAARRFKVGDASVIRWVAVYEESGRTQPLNSGGDKRSKRLPHVCCRRRA